MAFLKHMDDLEDRFPITIEYEPHTLRLLIKHANTGELVRYTDVTYMGNVFGPTTFEFETREPHPRHDDFEIRKEWVVYRNHKGETEAVCNGWETERLFIAVR